MVRWKDGTGNRRAGVEAVEMRLDRFREPTAADEKAYCQNCFQKFHYTELIEGYCADCQPEEQDEP